MQYIQYNPIQFTLFENNESNTYATYLVCIEKNLWCCSWRPPPLPIPNPWILIYLYLNLEDPIFILDRKECCPVYRENN